MMQQKQRFYRNHSHEYKERMLARPVFPSKRLDITVLRRCEEKRWSGRGGTGFAHNGQSSLGWLCRLLLAQRCSAKPALKSICALLPRWLGPTSPIRSKGLLLVYSSSSPRGGAIFYFLPVFLILEGKPSITEGQGEWKRLGGKVGELSLRMITLS